MEIKWKRYKKTADYTLARISYENIFSIDVIEPPIAGLSKQPLSTMNPGIYKLFLKTDLHSCQIIPRIQKIAGKPFFFLAPCNDMTNLLDVKHGVSTTAGFQFNFYLGKINGEVIAPDSTSFTKMITTMCIALKEKETIKIVVE